MDKLKRTCKKKSKKKKKKMDFELARIEYGIRYLRLSSVYGERIF
jgi:hypothetical protein